MKYTPQTIADKNLYFSIPIYQRLFEWKVENVQTLLADLHSAFNKGAAEYYIGMLTATEDNYDLVDGQQRFTVMMLLGCVLQNYDERWLSFLYGARARIHFSSRPNDESELMELIVAKGNKPNTQLRSNMEIAIDVIERYFKKLDISEQIGFSSYIYEHMCFFISYLPSKYKAQDLNKYFERMNSSGKNLEQHEILKVKLLSKLSGDINKYMQLWNRISDVDSLLILKREKETEEDLYRRKTMAFKTDLDNIISPDCRIINGLYNEEASEIQSISDISPSSIVPSQRIRTDRDLRCAFRFPQLLLQALYWMRKGNVVGSIEDFFNSHRLLQTFNENLPYEGNFANETDIRRFLQILLHCRLAMDICFIRPMEYGYSLDMGVPDEDKDKKKLLMLESMLYVSASNNTNYKWFKWLMDSVNDHHGIPSAGVLFTELKHKDDEEHIERPSLDMLSYKNDVRYWFWRLDFYIWINRERIFADNSRIQSVAEKYVFIRNRSLEHIAPQTPMSISSMVWNETEEDEKLRDSFGNLVMISQGLNSSLQNESYEVKRAHVEAYCSGSKTGSIESLKLLVVYSKYREWNKDTIIEHYEEMYQWLIDSYK